jgi:hypothetical protein
MYIKSINDSRIEKSRGDDLNVNALERWRVCALAGWNVVGLMLKFEI